MFVLNKLSESESESVYCKHIIIIITNYNDECIYINKSLTFKSSTM